MKKCPKCGCTEFTASQVQKHRVMVDGDGKFIRNEGMMSNDPITGPYVCNSCNAEYQRLDELIDEVKYKRFSILYASQIGKAVCIDPVSKEYLINKIHDFADRELPCGYYLFSAASVDNRSNISGAIHVSEDPCGNKMVDLAEKWKKYDTISMPAAAELLTASRIKCKDGKLLYMYAVNTEEDEYVFPSYPKA